MQQTPQEKKDDSVLEIGFTSGFFTLSTGFGENENEIGVEIKGCGSFSSVFASSLVSSGFGFTGLFSGMYMGSSMDRFTPLHIRAHNQPHLYEPPKGLYISKASFSSSSSSSSSFFATTFFGFPFFFSSLLDFITAFSYSASLFLTSSSLTFVTDTVFQLPNYSIIPLSLPHQILFGQLGVVVEVVFHWLPVGVERRLHGSWLLLQGRWGRNVPRSFIIDDGLIQRGWGRNVSCSFVVHHRLIQGWRRRDIACFLVVHHRLILLKLGPPLLHTWYCIVGDTNGRCIVEEEGFLLCRHLSSAKCFQCSCVLDFVIVQHQIPRFLQRYTKAQPLTSSACFTIRSTSFSCAAALSFATFCLDKYRSTFF